MNKWDRMLLDGIDVSRVRELQQKAIRNAEPVQLPIPYEPPAPTHPDIIVPATAKNWMTQDELNMRSKNVMEFIRKVR